MGNLNAAKLTDCEDIVNVRYWLYKLTKKKYVQPDNLSYIETFNNLIESIFYQNNEPYVKLMFVKIGAEQYFSKKSKLKLTNKYIQASLSEVVNKTIKPDAIKLTQIQIDYICNKKLFLGKYICYNTTNSTQISFISPKDNRVVIIRPTFLYIINTKYVTTHPAINIDAVDSSKECNVASNKYDTYNNDQLPKTFGNPKYLNMTGKGQHVNSQPVKLHCNSEHNSSIDEQQHYRNGYMIHEPVHRYYPKNKNAPDYHNIISHKDDNYHTKNYYIVNTPAQDNYDPIVPYTSKKQTVYITPDSITRQNNLTKPRRHRIYNPDVEYTQDFDERNIKWYDNTMYRSHCI